MGLTDAAFSTVSGAVSAYTFLVIYYVKYTIIYLLYVVIRVVDLFSITTETKQKRGPVVFCTDGVVYVVYTLRASPSGAFLSQM